MLRAMLEKMNPWVGHSLKKGFRVDITLKAALALGEFRRTCRLCNSP